MLIPKFLSLRSFAVALICVPLLFATGCGGGEDDEAVNGSPLPSDLSGREIDFTVVNPGQTGLKAGMVIRWKFQSGGKITGTNPATGVTYTPYSFTYVYNNTSGTVRVNYSQGSTLPYEIYSMRSSTSTTGTYDYEGDTGSGVKTADGTYQIIK